MAIRLKTAVFWGRHQSKSVSLDHFTLTSCVRHGMRRAASRAGTIRR